MSERRSRLIDEAAARYRQEPHPDAEIDERHESAHRARMKRPSPAKRAGRAGASVLGAAALAVGGAGILAYGAGESGPEQRPQLAKKIDAQRPDNETQTRYSDLPEGEEVTIDDESDASSSASY